MISMDYTTILRLVVRGLIGQYWLWWFPSTDFGGVRVLASQNVRQRAANINLRRREIAGIGNKQVCQAEVPSIAMEDFTHAGPPFSSAACGQGPHKFHHTCVPGSAAMCAISLAKSLP